MVDVSKIQRYAHDEPMPQVPASADPEMVVFLQGMLDLIQRILIRDAMAKGELGEELNDGLALKADKSAFEDHSARHELGGADVLNVGGLSGELADKQKVKQHALGGADHTAATLSELNALVSDATLDDIGATRTPASHGNEAHTVDYLPASEHPTFVVGNFTGAGSGTKVSFPFQPWFVWLERSNGNTATMRREFASGTPLTGMIYHSGGSSNACIWRDDEIEFSSNNANFSNSGTVFSYLAWGVKI
jgi:hypothetical protein